MASLLLKQNTQFDPILVLVLLQQLFGEGVRYFSIHNTCLSRKNLINKLTLEDLDSARCRKNENEIAQEFNKQLEDIVKYLYYSTQKN